MNAPRNMTADEFRQCLRAVYGDRITDESYITIASEHLELSKKDVEAYWNGTDSIPGIVARAVEAMAAAADTRGDHATLFWAIAYLRGLMRFIGNDKNVSYAADLLRRKQRQNPDDWDTRLYDPFFRAKWPCSPAEALWLACEKPDGWEAGDRFVPSRSPFGTSPPEQSGWYLAQYIFAQVFFGSSMRPIGRMSAFEWQFPFHYESEPSLRLSGSVDLHCRDKIGQTMRALVSEWCETTRSGMQSGTREWLEKSKEPPEDWHGEWSWLPPGFEAEPVFTDLMRDFNDAMMSEVADTDEPKNG